MSQDVVQALSCVPLEEMPGYGGVHVFDGECRGHELGAFFALLVFWRVTDEP